MKKLAASALVIVFLLSGCGKITHDMDRFSDASTQASTHSTAPLSEKEQVRSNIRIMGTHLQNVYRAPDPNPYTNILVFWRNESNKLMEKVQFELTAYYEQDQKNSAYENITITEEQIPPTIMGYYYHDKENKKEEWAPILTDIPGAGLSTVATQMTTVEPQSIKGWSGEEYADYDAYITRNGQNIKLSTQEKLKSSAMAAVGAFRYPDGTTKKFDHVQINSITIQYSSQDVIQYDGELAEYAIW